MAEDTPKRERGWMTWLRPWLRALHRDVGYLLVGLTVVYALSGIAVNHVQDWDPNFHSVQRVVHLRGPLPTDDDAAGAAVMRQLGIAGEADEVTRVDATRLDVVIGRRTLHVDATRNQVIDEGQQPRFLLRSANWLHLARGKKAWKYIADGYAVLLLYLACSGMFMLPGRRGLWGRGGVLVTLGAAVPIVYVVLSGGPGGH
jgi:uncharacterized protein